MLQALQIMFVAMVISVITGFLVSLLIQILCRLLKPRQQESDDAELIALAIAVAQRSRDCSVKRSE